jgi:hypothetical protein
LIRAFDIDDQSRISPFFGAFRPIFAILVPFFGVFGAIFGVLVPIFSVLGRIFGFWRLFFGIFAGLGPGSPEKLKKNRGKMRGKCAKNARKSVVFDDFSGKFWVFLGCFWVFFGCFRSIFEWILCVFEGINFFEGWCPKIYF